jgi:pimeloyl-ACP methyl ester carboxylesterase
VVDRVVGPGKLNTDIDSQGKLIGLDQMVANGVVARRQTLRLRVSPGPRASAAGGRYSLSVAINDSPAQTIFVEAGEGGSDVSFEVDTSHLRFAAIDPDTRQPPAKGVNWIQIAGNFGEIPLSNPIVFTTEYNWDVTAVLELRALYPVVLVHGWNAREDWFSGAPLQPAGTRFQASLDPGFKFELDSRRIPLDMTLRLGMQVSIEDGASNLERDFNLVLKHYGVNHVHFIAHSKGGIFVRSVLKKAASPRPLVDREDQEYRLGVYSLTSLDTPHHGNRMADALLPTILFELPAIGGTRDLGTIRMRLFNRSHRSPPDWFQIPIESQEIQDTNRARYFSTRAHADLDNNGKLNPFQRQSSPSPGQTVFDELEGYNPLFTRAFIKSMFQITGRRLTTLPFQLLSGLLSWPLPRAPWAFEKNDSSVSVNSARYDGFQDVLNIGAPSGDPTIFDANHSTMGKSSVAAAVITQAVRLAQPMQ